MCLSRRRPLVRIILVHNRCRCQLVCTKRVRAVFRSGWCGRTRDNTRPSRKNLVVAVLLLLFLLRTNNDPKRVMTCWEIATPRIDRKTTMMTIVVVKHLPLHQHHLPVPMMHRDPSWMDANTVAAVMTMTTTTIIVAPTLPTTMALSQALHVQHQQQSTTAAPLWSCPSHRQMDAPNLRRDPTILENCPTGISVSLTILLVMITVIPTRYNSHSTNPTVMAWYRHPLLVDSINTWFGSCR